MTRKHQYIMMRNQKQCKISPRDAAFEVASDLVEMTGISFSEALGYTLGVENVSCGWEYNLSEDEFQALIDR